MHTPTRRRFLRTTLLASAGLWITNSFGHSPRGYKPIVLSTWSPNVKANAGAWKILGAGGRALDAIEAGIHVPESDPDDQSVGYGGLPDRDGRVTLDACIMDEQARCGAVMGLEEIRHPISVARRVMERTPHVQIVGAGALEFAVAQGFPRENLLTDKSRKAWEDWKKKSHYDPQETFRNMQQRMRATPDQHDTIGMIAMDQLGNLSGGCSTSGLAYKMQGRVGDSPIIGAGLFVDNEVGAATATGMGEEVVRVCGSFLVVELMRQGYSPEQACRKAVERVAKNNVGKSKDLQVGFIAINKAGEYGGFSLTQNFSYAVQVAQGPFVVPAGHLL